MKLIIVDFDNCVTRLRNDRTVMDPGFSPVGEGVWGVANSPSVCANLFFLAENCIKMKEFWPPGGRVPGAPLRSATAEAKLYA